MSAILDKAAAHATAKKFDSVVLAQSRLFPDMHPLSRQVQIACDTAKGAAGRLAGIEVPKHEDTETTLPELKARIAKTVDFLKTVTAAQMAGDENRAIEIKFPNGAWKFTALELPDRFRAAEFLFSRQHGLRVAAQERRRSRQARFSRRHQLASACRTWAAAGLLS